MCPAVTESSTRETASIVGLRRREESVSYAPVSAVVVTHNSADVLGGLLDSLREALAGVGDAEVVVVDNLSKDGSAAFARAHPVGARVLETGRNGGYAAGINAAFRAIAPDRAVLVLNPDIRLRPGTIGRLLDRVVQDRRTGIVVPRILDEDGTLSRSLRREPSVLTAWSDALLGGTLAERLGTGEVIGRSRLYAEGGEVDWATGCIVLVSPRARALVGPWDESFFLYSEEVDYMRRVREAGLSVVYVPDAEVTHIGGEGNLNPRLAALMTVNRVRYYARHQPRWRARLFHAAVVTGTAIRALAQPHRPTHRASLRAVLGERKETFS